MKYTIKVNEAVSETNERLKGFASVTFGDSLKVRNIAIYESQKGSLYVKMPAYHTGERDGDDRPIYKDIFYPMNREFREELYDNILDAFAECEEGKNEISVDHGEETLDYDLQVVANKGRRSNVKAFARIILEDSFVIGQVKVKQSWANEEYVDMPSVSRKNDDGKTERQSICYPVTAEFREKLYGQVMEKYHEARDKSKKTVGEVVR